MRVIFVRIGDWNLCPVWWYHFNPNRRIDSEIIDWQMGIRMIDSSGYDVHRVDFLNFWWKHYRWFSALGILQALFRALLVILPQKFPFFPEGLVSMVRTLEILPCVWNRQLCIFHCGWTKLRTVFLVLVYLVQCASQSYISAFYALRLWHLRKWKNALKYCYLRWLRATRMSKFISCVLNGLVGGVSLLNRETIEVNSRTTDGWIHETCERTMLHWSPSVDTQFAT